MKGTNGLREFESLTVNRTHGLADGEDSETKDVGVSQVLSVPDLKPVIGGAWGAGGLGRHSIGWRWPRKPEPTPASDETRASHRPGVQRAG